MAITAALQLLTKKVAANSDFQNQIESESERAERSTYGSTLVKREMIGNVLGRFRTILGRQTPCFELPADQISCITEPDVFYTTLMANIRTAKRRVVLASLYLGTGEKEQKLVELLDQTLAKRQQEQAQNGRGASEGSAVPFQVEILVDRTRGTRGEPSSSYSMLVSARHTMRTAVLHICQRRK